MSRYYITTTLPYVNADPHIGFALEIVQADALARWRRHNGDEVIFNTGTDEHGLKIYRNAEEAGMSPQDYSDRNAAKFDLLKKALNLSYTHFIRTTDKRHMKAAQTFWRLCSESGDIYKKEYAVKYCVGCELEKTDSELVGGACPLHPNLNIEIIEEENYFFRFSRYQDALLRIYTERPDFVVPDFRLKEIRKFVERGLEDFSVSRLREKMPWGVPVPGDSGHVMYVWFDALVNYVSTLGWPEDKESFGAWWPGVQVAGKDNLRQQSAMWQAMLLSAGFPPSKQIFIHGFITSDGEKMSKSLGNVIDPFAMVEKYGTDAVRYYLLSVIPAYGDGDFTNERFVEIYNSALANDLGNLISRVLKMVEQYMDGKVEALDPLNTLDKLHTFMESYQFDRAIGEIWNEISWANKFIEEKKPWEMWKKNKSRQEKVKSSEYNELCEVLEVLVASLRQIADNLAPFMPGTAERMLELLNRDILKAPEEPLFPRIS